MADASWEPSSLLVKDLLSCGHEFSFHQVMHLARTVLGPDTAPGLPEVPWQERLHIRPDLSLAFPAADVARVERSGQDGSELLVTTTFLGLYGSSSPLPTHYTEDLMDEAAAGSSVCRDFLDIIHERLYRLYSQCWSKYRLFIQVAEEKNPPDQERLFCLIGLGDQELRDCLPDSWSLVRYAGLLTQFSRSAEGLQTLLRDALGLSQLEVVQCVLRTVQISKDQHMRLGLSSMCLGVDTVLGSEMPDRASKIRIEIGPLSKKTFDSLLPGTELHDKLTRLVRLYINDPLVCDLRITIAAQQVRPISLGDPAGSRLGLNTWCFSGATLDEVSATFPLASSALPLPATACGAYDVDDPIGGKEPSSLIDHYQRELAGLRDLMASYAESHPELSSMISGHVSDPSIERLLEGVAFLNANLQLKLADDFPEIIHPLVEAFQPWHMRAIPATTIVAFTSKPGLVQPLRIAAGTEVASLSVKGVTCRFRTCFDVTVLPLTLIDATLNHPSGKAPRIELVWQLNGMPLSAWKAESLRFYLGDDYPDACKLYLLLMRYMRRIIVTAQGSDSTVDIPVDCIKPAGFGADEAMLPAKSIPVSGHQLLQEYFLFPDKYFFVDLHGMEGCSNLGTGSRFCITFELNHCPFSVPPIHKTRSFILSAVPVINLFHHKAKPLVIQGDTSRQLISPAGKTSDHCHIYSVDEIREFDMQAEEEKLHSPQTPFSQAPGCSDICRITYTASPLGEGFDTWVSLENRTGKNGSSKTKLNIDLTCTNGALPEQLAPGAINCATTTTPESAEFRNIKPVTAAIPPDTGNNRYWRVLASLSLSSLSLNRGDRFRAILRHHIPLKCRNLAQVEAHKKRINGIREIRVCPSDRLIKGRIYRGYDIHLSVCVDHYSGPGDLFLFCSVLERFLGGYVTDNYFIRLVVEEINSGCIFEWPARMGGER
jgi:type VI secretion system protein ImpG